MLNGMHSIRVCNHSTALLWFALRPSNQKEGQASILPEKKKGPAAPFSSPGLELSKVLPPAHPEQLCLLQAEPPTCSVSSTCRGKCSKVQQCFLPDVRFQEGFTAEMPEELCTHPFTPDSWSTSAISHPGTRFDSLPSVLSCHPQIKNIYWHNFTAQAISSHPLLCTMQTLSFLWTGSSLQDQIEVLVCWKADPALAPSADLWGESRTCFAFYRLFPWCTEVPIANSAAAELQKIA